MASGHVGMMGSSLRQLNIVLLTLVLTASYCDSIHDEFVDTQEVQLKPMDHGALSEISNWFGNLHPQKQQSIDLSSEDISIGSLRKTKRSNYGKNMLNTEGEDLKHELKNKLVIRLKKPESNANKNKKAIKRKLKKNIYTKKKRHPSTNNKINKIKCTQKLKVKPKQIKIKDNSKSKRTFKENSKKMQNDYYYDYATGSGDEGSTYIDYASGSGGEGATYIDYDSGSGGDDEDNGETQAQSGDGAVGEEYETSGQSGDATDREVDEEIEATGQSGDGTDGEVDEELEPDGQSGDGTGCSNGGSGDYGGNTWFWVGFGGSNGNSNGYGNSNAAADQALAELGALIPGGGVPGVDYPVIAEVPDTDFECFAPGYYADTAPEAGCQVFHICQDGGLVDSFLCPNGTIFNQQYFVCDWWYNFDCATAEDFYELNGLIGQEPGQYDTLNDGTSTGSYSAPGANDNGNVGFGNGNGKNYRKGNGNRNGSNINGNGHNNGGNVNGVSGSSPSALYNAPSRNGDGNGGGNGFTNGVHGSDNGSPFASHSAPGQNSNGNEYSNGNDNGFNSDLPSKLYRTPGF